MCFIVRKVSYTYSSQWENLQLKIKDVIPPRKEYVKKLTPLNVES
jgi:hypothetical protein